MFSGIVNSCCTVEHIEWRGSILHYSVTLPHPFSKGLIVGASVAIDGVCQSVVSIEGDRVSFDAIEETLKRTTLKTLKKGDQVHVERSLRLGDEIGGHLLSGHVYGTVTVASIDEGNGRYVLTLESPLRFMKYIFEKGYVALDGCSLTIVSVDQAGLFTVHLIPDTLARTKLRKKTVGSAINLELDSQTVTIVNTLERIHATASGREGDR